MFWTPVVMFDDSIPGNCYLIWVYTQIFCHGRWKFGFYFDVLRGTISYAATSPTVELCVSAHTLSGAAVFWTVRSCKLICINLRSVILLHYKLDALINLMHYLQTCLKHSVSSCVHTHTHTHTHTHGAERCIERIWIGRQRRKEVSCHWRF